MSTAFMEAVKQRRSYYGIGKKEIVPRERIEKIVAESIQHIPSSFHSQSSRAAVLFGEQSDQLWAITKETLREIVPADQFADTAQRIDGFASGYGTVLFFEDQEVVRGLQKRFAAYADNFPIWSNQSSGMLQFVVWTALELEGLGASLQHYNPLIDEKVGREWGFPSDWKLIAQMPFGAPTFTPGEKTFEPLDTRLRVISGKSIGDRL